MLKLNATQQRILFISLILGAMMTRLIPHAPNYTAVGAVALFGGFAFRSRALAFLVPMAAMFLSDLLLNNTLYSHLSQGFVWLTSGFAFIYGGILISVVLGRYATRGFRLLPLLGAGAASILVFFLLTNFGSWLLLPQYTKDFTGLMLAYSMGLPFLLNQLLGTALYGTLLFGTAYLVKSPRAALASHA